MDLKTLKNGRNTKNGLNPSKSHFIADTLHLLTKKDIKLFKSSNNKKKQRFFSEIGMLLSAGIDLQTILTLSVANSNSKSELFDIYKKILNKITQGSGLAGAMQDTSQFNNFDCYSVLIGENTGDLAHVFDRLSSYYAKRIAQRRKIMSSLSYPIIVLFTTIGAIYFMLKFVVPMFSETLIRFGGELPALTKFIITLSHNISTYFIFVLVFVAIGYILYRRNRHKETVKRILSLSVTRTPYIGKIVLKNHLVEFTQAMDLLLNSKVNVVESIELTLKIVSFYPLKKALEQVKLDLLRGEYFYKSMEKQKYFDLSMITLIRIGEEINQLDKIFAQLSKQYENELEYQSGILISILEPVMILILAMLVAVILVAMYLPMFKIGTIIH